MSTEQNCPDPAILLKRMEVIACDVMRLPRYFADELISDLVGRWWRLGWDKVGFPISERLDPWLRRCLNRWMVTKMIRNAARLQRDEEFARFASARYLPKTEDGLIGEELKRFFSRVLLEEAKPRVERVFWLKYEGCSDQEIARSIERSERTVRNDLELARNLICRRLLESGHLIR